MGVVLIQETAFDVASWEEDPEFGVFPQGARAKDAVFAPMSSGSKVLVPGKRYMFKRSKGSYPDQFWAEVVAYRVGCLLGVSVPPAFIALNSATGLCATLIEWFYEDSHERFVLAGDFLQKAVPEFDRDKGQMHNVTHNGIILRALQKHAGLEDDWRQWWADALLFDALIGNTDRHQDNWGIIFFSAPDTRSRLTPLFDNGTSLGHERFPHLVASWDEQRIEKYIENGRHHAHWSVAEPIRGHFALLERCYTAWPQTVSAAKKRLSFDDSALHSIMDDLHRLQLPVPLAAGRAEFMLRLLQHRLRRLRDLVDRLK